MLPCINSGRSEEKKNNYPYVGASAPLLHAWGFFIGVKHMVDRAEFMRRKALTCKKYEKTRKGFLMRLYRNMQSRVEGVQRLKHHLYKGKYLLPREEFYAWALENDTFHKLFTDYEQSGHKRKLAPSVDRVNSSRGYSLDNMEFVTMSENSRRGAVNRYKTEKGENNE